MRIRVAFLVALTLAAVPTAAARATSSAAAASPSSDLVDGQYVLVSWSGFPAGGAVFLRQCAASPTSVSQCVPEFNSFGQPASVEASTGQDGTGKVYLPVAYGTLPGGVKCTSSTPCSIGVFNDPKDVTTAAFAPLSFEFPPSACPIPTGTTVFGSGADSSFRAMLQWEGTVCRPPYGQSVEYTLKNDVDGMKDFVSKLTNFTETSLPLSTGQLAVLEHANRRFGYAPLTQSSLTFAYRLYDRQTGEQITDLELTPQILAEIFTGQIKNWNDPSITALNPGHQFPSIIHAIARADNCAASWEVTSWFDAVAKNAYEAGGSAYQGGPTTIYPDTGQIDYVTGAQAAALGVARPPQDSDPQTFGFIGFMDSSLARLYGLPTVKIQNQGGQFVGPTDEAVLAAVKDAVAASGGASFVQPDYTNTDPAAYPLPTITYAVAPTSSIKPDEARVLRGFLRFAAGKGQTALPGGYLPLLDSFATTTKGVAAHIPVSRPQGGGGDQGGGAGGGRRDNRSDRGGGDGSGGPGGGTTTGSSGGSFSGGTGGVVPGRLPSSSDTGGSGTANAPPPQAAGESLGQYLVRSPLATSGPTLLLLAIVLGCGALVVGPVVLLIGWGFGEQGRAGALVRRLLRRRR